jgi:two-component system CheB/CheR fusion protein
MESDKPTFEPRLRVLVVEDNDDIARSLAMLLELWGHDAAIVDRAEAALEAVRTHRPAVVLMDIGLPGMDGYEVAKMLRRQEGCDKVMLVAMTGYGQDEDRRRAQEAGFDRHLVKPVDPDVLQELLANCESLTRAPRERELSVKSLR